MPALLLLSGPSAGLRIEVTREVIVGRSPSCEIPLEDGRVSRRHARIFVEDDQTKIVDLGSRNGTVVNDEKVDGEAILLPGDRVQVGETTILFEPPATASLGDRETTGEVTHALVEEILPRTGNEGALLSAGTALLGATSEEMVLRRTAEELARSLHADCASALLGGTEGLLTAAVVGAETVEVQRSMAHAALERRETTRAGGVLCAPLVASGGQPFGVLYAQRAEPEFSADEEALIASIGRLGGEAYAATRERTLRQLPTRVLVGSSRAFRKSLEQARRAAANRDPVVLHGEFGTGRTATAHYIHSRSGRALGPLVFVDCQQSGVEEELLGRSGAPGVPPLSSALLRADGGTLVLQHLEALDPPHAAWLARHLSRRTAPARQGGEEPVDVRVIATCVLSPQQLVERGELPLELARALSGHEVEILPLRERRADVPALFESFAQAPARSLRKEPPTLTPDARRLLVDYGWPRNVLELRQVAERLALLYAGQEISALKLPPEIQSGELTEAAKSLHAMVQRLERDAISEALREAKGKKIKAAELLGISRPTLDKKIEDYALVVEKVRASK